MVTKTEEYLTIIQILSDIDAEKYQQSIDFCKREMELIEQKGLRAKSRATLKKMFAEPDPLAQALYNKLTNHLQTIPELLKQIDVPGATTSKAAYRLSELVDLGLAEGQEICFVSSKVGFRKRMLKAYKLADEE